MSKSKHPAPLWSARVDEYPRAMCWSADGERLAVGSASGRISVLRTEDGKIERAFAAHAGGLLSLAFHPQEDRLVSAGEDGAVRLWTGEDALTLLSPAEVWAGEVAWSPSGDLLAAAAGRSVAVFDSDGSARGHLRFPDSTVAAIAWSPDGGTLAAAGYGGVRLFAPRSGEVKQTLAWKGSMLSLTWSPDGQVVACGCQDNSLHFWRLPGGDDAQMSGYPLKPLAISWSHDGKLLASSGGAVVTVWSFDGEGPEGRRPLELDGHLDPVTAVAFAPAVGVLATGCKKGRVFFWLPGEAEKPVRLHRMEERIEKLAWGLAPRLEQMLLAGVDAGGAVTVWPFL
jgi:WD40 repeat protein